MKQLFATNRLEICELTEKDKIFFVELLSDPEIINPIPQPKWSYMEIEEKFEGFRNYAINPLEKEKVLWGVYEKGTDELIGLCALLTNSDDQREIGYRFRKKYWGKGYGSELTKNMIDYCFNVLQLELITADVNIDNTRSVKILDKFFEPVKEFFNTRDNCTDRRYSLSRGRVRHM